MHELDLLRLRPLRQRDGDTIAMWFQDAETRLRMGGMLPLDKWLAFILAAPTQQVWMVENERQQAVGLIQVEWAMPTRAWLSLIVHPAWRRRGYGRQILRRISADLCQRGAREICCEIAADNVASLHGATAHGFIGDSRAAPTPVFLAFVYHCAMA